MWFSRKLISIISILQATATVAIPPLTDDPSTTSNNAAPQGPPEGYDASRFIITYKNSIGAQAAEKAASNVHVRLGRHNAMAASIPPAAVEGLRNNPNIANIEEDSFRYMLSQTSGSFLRGSNTHERRLQSKPYGISMVQADQVSLGNDVKKVCIIDSGYSVSHPDLPTSGVDGFEGYDGKLKWDEDPNGHGTHVAGTIAAVDDLDGVIGVAPGVDLYIVRVFDAEGWAYSSTLIDALDKCVAAGSKVVNMSLGSRFPQTAESDAFERAFIEDGVLSIAAAGNDGNTQNSYPASYENVVSVAAIDSTKTIASFSQQNSQVELSAPGVGVLSTGVGIAATVTVGGVSFAGGYIDLSVKGTTEQGTLCDCGLAESPCNACSQGGICLIERGNISFREKTINCRNGGGVAALIYNNALGGFSGTLKDAIDDPDNIPSISLSQSDGQSLMSSVGQLVTIDVSLEPEDAYISLDGTSMATPHVVGVAALVWSNFPSCSNCEIRNALAMSAEDLGRKNRDDAYGYGLVQAKAAMDYLNTNGCTGDMTLSICSAGGGGSGKPGGKPDNGGGGGGGRPNSGNGNGKGN